MSNIHAIAFDCFGTLIDWEAGILDADRVHTPGAFVDRVVEPSARNASSSGR